MQDHRLTSARRIRLGPWRGMADVLTVATFSDQPLGDDDVDEILLRATRAGVRHVVTAAVTPAEAEPFRRRGFDVTRHLVLLRRPLDAPVPSAGVGLRRWRRRDLAPVLEVDNAAFDAFWSFDEVALRDAMSATPHRVLRVTRERPIEAYALSGLSGTTGYLQRLAVHPRSAGRGLGTALVRDGLRWMRWRGATEAYVNTQSDNARAAALYEREGFRRLPEGLVVLERDVDDRS